MSGIRAALERGLSHFYTKKAISCSSYRLAAFGFRNVMNHAPTPSELSFAVPFGVIKYLYKYCFILSLVTH